MTRAIERLANSMQQGSQSTSIPYEHGIIDALTQALASDGYRGIRAGLYNLNLSTISCRSDYLDS